MTQWRQSEAAGELGLHEDRATFIATIRELVKDGSMVLLRIFTALKHQSNQGPDLSPGVTGVVNMGRGLGMNC